MLDATKISVPLALSGKIRRSANSGLTFPCGRNFLELNSNRYPFEMATWSLISHCPHHCLWSPNARQTVGRWTCIITLALLSALTESNASLYPFLINSGIRWCCVFLTLDPLPSFILSSWPLTPLDFVTFGFRIGLGRKQWGGSAISLPSDWTVQPTDWPAARGRVSFLSPQDTSCC